MRYCGVAEIERREVPGDQQGGPGPDAGGRQVGIGSNGSSAAEHAREGLALGTACPHNPGSVVDRAPLVGSTIAQVGSRDFSARASLEI